MKFTVRTERTNTAPLAVSTENAAEALQSLREFQNARLRAAIYDELDRPLSEQAMKRFIAAEIGGKPKDHTSR